VKKSRTPLITALAIGLLAGSAVGVVAQDEDEVAAPVPFTVRFLPSNSLRAAQTTTEDGVTKELGNCWAPVIASPSDPRLAGTLTFCSDDHSYGAIAAESDVGVWSTTYRIENDGGAWQGSSAGVAWVDPESGDMMETEELVIFVGEDAYEGLYAAMTFLPDWSDIRGVIFEGAPPAAPVPPSAQ
jgi:hypothetical protein